MSTTITTSDYRALYGIPEGACIDCRQPCSLGDARCTDCREWLADIAAAQTSAAPKSVTPEREPVAARGDLLRSTVGAVEVAGTARENEWPDTVEDGGDIIAATAATGFDDDARDAEMAGAGERFVLLLRAIKTEIGPDSIVRVNDIRGYYSHFTRRQMRQVSAWFTSLCSMGILTRLGRETSTDTVGRNQHNPASVFRVNRMLLDDALANPRGFAPRSKPAKKKNRAARAAAKPAPVAAPVAPVLDPVVETPPLW